MFAANPLLDFVTSLVSSCMTATLGSLLSEAI